MNKAIGGFGMLVGGLIVAASIAGCEVITKVSHGGTQVTGTGPVKTDERTVSAFKSVDAGSAFIVDIKIGAPQKVTVEAQENLVPIIETAVEDGTLKIRCNDSLSSDHPLLVHVVVPNLESFNVSGGAHGQVDGLKEATFQSNVSGGAKLKLNGTADDLSVNASGGSEIVVSGLDSKSIKLVASGGGSILAAGKAEKASVEATGGSQIHAEDLLLQDADVNASGAGNVTLNVSKMLNATASGASTIRYSGDAKTNTNSNGASNVSHTP